MATENFYLLQGRAIAHVTGLADTNDFDVAPDDWSLGNVDIHTFIVGGSCDVKILTDSAGDFASPETNITVDSFSGAGISEGNATPLQKGQSALRITNTSGGTADFVVIGEAQHGGRD